MGETPGLNEITVLILEESDPSRRSRLEASFAAVPNVKVEKPNERQENRPLEAEAVYVSFMMGLEIGAPTVFGRAHVVELSPERQVPGFPSYCVVGTAWSPDDAPSQPHERLRENLKNIREALLEFNSGAKTPIRVWRAQPGWLIPSDTDPELAIEVIRQVLGRD